MAPEYARGRTIDARSDIYTLGCGMYEALAGREPFTGANYNALLFAIQEGNAEPLREIRSDVPSDFVDVVEKAMAKEPDARFQTAREMEAALERWAIAPSLGPESRTIWSGRAKFAARRRATFVPFSGVRGPE